MQNSSNLLLRPVFRPLLVHRSGCRGMICDRWAYWRRFYDGRGVGCQLLRGGEELCGVIVHPRPEQRPQLRELHRTERQLSLSGLRLRLRLRLRHRLQLWLRLRFRLRFRLRLRLRLWRRLRQSLMRGRYETTGLSAACLYTRQGFVWAYKEEDCAPLIVYRAPASGIAPTVLELTAAALGAAPASAALGA